MVKANACSLSKVKPIVMRLVTLVCACALMCVFAGALLCGCMGGDPQPNGPATPGADAIHVTVEIDCANAHAYNEKWPTDMGTFRDVALNPGSTAFDALAATGVKYSTRGDYVDSIGGLAERACGATSGWMYFVDGVAPTKSAMKFEISDGALIRWAYTVTDGDVEGS